MGFKGFDAAIVNGAAANPDISEKMLVDCRGDCIGKTPELNANAAFWHIKSLNTSATGMLNIPQFKENMAEALNGIYKGAPISVDVKLSGGNMDVKAFRVQHPGSQAFDPKTDALVWSRNVAFLQTHD